MPERAVVLDIGGVLEVTPAENGWRARWADEAGVPRSALHEDLSDVWRDGSLGRITEAAAVEAMRARLGHEVGLAKPDPAVYELTARRLGVRPDQVVFLDDTPAAVDGARSAGWQAVRFEDTRQAIAEVEALLGSGR